MIEPFTIIACHFKKKHNFINNIIKKYHINSITNLSHTTIIVYSSDDDQDSWISEFIDSLKKLTTNRKNVQFIYDQTNTGWDFGKWSMVIKLYSQEVVKFNWFGWLMIVGFHVEIYLIF